MQSPVRDPMLNGLTACIGAIYRAPRILCLALIACSFSMTTCIAQESSTLLDFATDIKPILDAKCLECHGPDEAKNDYRVDDAETMLDYLEAGDLENSFLWTDYLITDDPDMKMPPPEKPQLTGQELALIRVWIEEGAEWSETEITPEDEEGETQSEEPAQAMSPTRRMFIFQGLFHPATVHFPIALLTVSSLCLLLSFVNRDSFEPVAFHCLWIGALGGVAACVAGWGYAIFEGYGAGFSFQLQDSAIDRHRWLGIGVAAFALILLPMARSARKKGDFGMRFLWLIGSLFITLGVSFVGYQGGELTYGEDHYAKEYEKLFPTEENETTAAESPAEGDEGAGEDDAAADESAQDTETVATEVDSDDTDSDGESDESSEGDSGGAEDEDSSNVNDSEADSNSEAN